jgi:hypothetical protein
LSWRRDAEVDAAGCGVGEQLVACPWRRLGRRGCGWLRDGGEGAGDVPEGLAEGDGVDTEERGEDALGHAEVLDDEGGGDEIGGFQP